MGNTAYSNNRSVKDSALLYVEDAQQKELFHVTQEGRLFWNGVDISDDDVATAACFRAAVKGLCAVKIQRTKNATN